MQAWQIIVASAVVASIAVAALFLPGAVRSPTGATSLFQTYWAGIAIVWVGVYGVAALVLSTATAIREIGNTAPDRAWMDWPRDYLSRLGVTHYFSAVLILLALGLLPLAVVTEPFFPIPAVIGLSPALAACAAAILVGVSGWITVTAVTAFRIPPARTASIAGLDTQLLREIVELLRARPAEPVLRAEEFVEQLRQRDRSTLEAIKELAGAVSRVRNGIFEIQHGLQRRGPEQADQSGAAAPADVAETAGELRAATAALTAAVAKLEDIAAGLAALSPLGVSAPARGNLPPGSRSQLSTELQELLRDMATGSVSPQEGSR
ncbi:MAG: hypothetical protein AB7H90_06815 [Alphaproteobacteria bacterium]